MWEVLGVTRRPDHPAMSGVLSAVYGAAGSTLQPAQGQHDEVGRGVPVAARAGHGGHLSSPGASFRALFGGGVGWCGGGGGGGGGCVGGCGGGRACELDEQDPCREQSEAEADQSCCREDVARGGAGGQQEDGADDRGSAGGEVRARRAAVSSRSWPRRAKRRRKPVRIP